MDLSVLVLINIAISFTVSVILAILLSWGFEFVALCGLLVTYGFVLEGLTDIWVELWLQYWKSSSSIVQPFNLRFTWIMTLETISVTLLCAILVRLGRRYRLDNTSASIGYKLAVAGVVLNAMYFIVCIIFIADILRNNTNNSIVKFNRLQGATNVALLLGPQIVAYLYAFTPSLRVMFAMNSTRYLSNAIGAHRAAEGTWYAGFAMLHLIYEMIHRFLAYAANDEPLNTLHDTLRVAFTSFALLAFAIPAPVAIVERLERKYACRVTPKFEEGLL